MKKKLGEQLQPPIILRESSEDDVLLGSRKILPCNAIGYPPPTYMRLREWQNLISNFSKFTKNDVGIVASKATHLMVCSLSHDNKHIIPNEKYFITSTYNLVILNTEYQDEKIYFAIIENIFVGSGTRQSPDYCLQINRRKSSFQLSIPEFIVKPTDQLATIGDPIKSFECVANAG
ncbi:unnamed protein product [Rotaria sp. Silwood2]|nr:unnamed protein product [Rotaria sp. Silwood2]CAF4557621.1 unnamed protein product [Rotaria sp. Silwood2]